MEEISSNSNTCPSEPWGRYSASGGLYTLNNTQQYLYSFGGDTTSDSDGRGGVVRTNFRFNLDSQCWERLNNSPVELGYRGTATWLQQGTDTVYVLFGADRARAATTNQYQYSLQNDTWTSFSSSTSTPPARWKHAAVPLDDKHILVTGGRDGSLVRDDAWILDTQDLSWTLLNTTGLPAMYRHGLAFDATRNVTWIYGGLGADLFRFPSQLWMLNMTDHVVTEVTANTNNNPLPPRLASHAMEYVDELDVVLMWGGTCSDDAELHIYDPTANSWCRIFPEQRPDRRDAMLWSLDYPYFYIAQGDSICYSRQVLTIADVHVLDFEDSLDKWQVLYEPTNVPRGTGMEPYCDGSNAGNCQPTPFLPQTSGTLNSTCSADLLARFFNRNSSVNSTTMGPTETMGPTKTTTTTTSPTPATSATVSATAVFEVGIDKSGADYSSKGPTASMDLSQASSLGGWMPLVWMLLTVVKLVL